MLKLVGNSTMWMDKSEIYPLHCSIVKRHAICRFGHVNAQKVEMICWLSGLFGPCFYCYKNDLFPFFSSSLALCLLPSVSQTLIPSQSSAAAVAAIRVLPLLTCRRRLVF
jgi:hypothetical protein